MEDPSTRKHRLVPGDLGLLCILHHYNSPPHVASSAFDDYCLAQHGMLQVVARACYGDQGKPESLDDLTSRLENAMARVNRYGSLMQGRAGEENLRAIRTKLTMLAEHGIESLLELMRKLKYAVATGQEDTRVTRGRARFSHESPLGVYVRRSLLTYDKLPFDACVELFNLFTKWCTRGPSDEPAVPRAKDEIAEAYSIFTDPWSDSVKSFAAARRYFDLKGNGRAETSHQGALHQTALLYFHQKAYPSAYAALAESIRLSRIAHDRKTVAKCNEVRRLLDRATGTDRRPLPPVLCGPPQAQATMETLRNVGEPLHKKGKEKQPQSSRPDDFWDLSEELPRLVGGTAEMEPIHMLYSRLLFFKTLNMPDVDGKEVFVKEDAWRPGPWHAVNAHLWHRAGQTDLCDVYSKLVRDLDDDTAETSDAKIYNAIERAGWLSKLARYEDALLVLFQEAAGMRFLPENASAWQVQVCKVVRDMCRHQGLHDLADRASRSSPEPIGDEAKDHVTRLLDECQTYLANGAPYRAMMPALEAVSLTDRLNHPAGHALATAAFCHALVHFGDGAAAWAAEAVEAERADEIPSVREWKGVEGYVRMTQARCLLIRAQAEGEDREARLKAGSKRLKQSAALYFEARDRASALSAIRYDALVHHALSSLATASSPPSSSDEHVSKRDTLSRWAAEAEAGAKRAKRAEDGAVRRMAERALAGAVDVPATYRALMAS